MTGIDFMRTGLLQFGRFQDTLSQRVRRYRLQLDMLAAYPTFFRATRDALLGQLPEETSERLVADRGAAVLAGSMSEKLGISLVYSRGCGEAPALDLIGAYDVGHPTVAIVNTDRELPDFLVRCDRVGLSVHTVLVLVRVTNREYTTEVRAMHSLDEMVGQLVESGDIPAGMGEAVRAEIDSDEGQ